MSYRTTRKMAKRKRIHRHILLQAAVTLFGDRGYHATTVPMIVKAARSSTGSFYFYFRNKEDVFAAALQAFADAFHAAIVGDAAPGSPTADPQRQLRAAVEHLVLLLTRNSAGARILLVESAGLSARLEHVRRAILDSQSRFFEELLARLAPSPQTPNATLVAGAPLVARCCIGSIHESVRHWLELPPDQRPAPQALATTVAEFNVRATVALQPQAGR